MFRQVLPQLCRPRIPADPGEGRGSSCRPSDPSADWMRPTCNRKGGLLYSAAESTLGQTSRAFGQGWGPHGMSTPTESCHALLTADCPAVSRCGVTSHLALLSTVFLPASCTDMLILLRFVLGLWLAGKCALPVAWDRVPLPTCSAVLVLSPPRGARLPGMIPSGFHSLLPAL